MHTSVKKEIIFAQKLSNGRFEIVNMGLLPNHHVFHAENKKIDGIETFIVQKYRMGINVFMAIND